MFRVKKLSLAAWLCTLLFLAQALSALPPSPQSMKIPDGTPLRLSLMDALSSATNQVDEPVHFEVTEDAKVGDVVAIPKSSTATGHIVEVQPKRRMGRAGKLNFSVDYVKAPDGTNVRLRASSTRQGEEKSGTVIVGTVLLSPLFLLMRGKDVIIPKGTAFNAYVDGDREISMGGPATPAHQAPAPAGLAAQPPPTETGELATVIVKSTPEGADVTVDGKYVGSAPASLRLTPGDHTVTIEKSGYRAWQRTISLSPGGINTIDATLERP